MLDAAEAATGERPGPIEQMTWARRSTATAPTSRTCASAWSWSTSRAVFARTEVRAFAAPCVKALVVAGGASFARSRLDALVERAKALGAKGLAWFRVAEADGARVLDSPLDRFLSDDERPACWRPPGPRPGTWCWWWPTSTGWRARCWASCGSTSAAGRWARARYRYVWVVEFPMFDGVDAEGNPVAAHHPFTMPHPDDLDLLETDPAAVRSQAYDLVLNGWELGSGSVRIHRADIQSPGLRRPGHLRRAEAEARFGFLLGRLPLRGAAPRRLRLRDRPSGGHLLPARRTSARSSPSPRPSPGPTP